MSKSAAAPTQAQSEAIQKAYQHFNTTLFNGELPECMLNFSRSGRRTMGFFIAATWEDRITEGEETRRLHEISSALPGSTGMSKK